MEDKSVTIRPNVKKIFILNIIKILIILIVVVIVIIVIDATAILDTLLAIFEIFNVVVEVNLVVYVLIILAVIFSLISLLINYLIVSGLNYEIYYDKIIYGKNLFLIFKNIEEINYKNIGRIYYSTKGLINQLFNTGYINIEFTGLDKKNIKLEFIDNIEQVTSYLQNVLSRYRARMYSIGAERQKLGDILDKGDI